MNTTYINVFNNDKILKSQLTIDGSEEKIFANIFILETEYKLKSRHTIKTEIQHLQTKQHFWKLGYGDD